MILDFAQINLLLKEFFFAFCLHIQEREKKEKENENYTAFAITLLVSLKTEKISLLCCNKIILGVQAKIKLDFFSY